MITLRYLAWVQSVSHDSELCHQSVTLSVIQCVPVWVPLIAVSHTILVYEMIPLSGC